MGNTRDTGYLRNLVIYDGSGNITLPANLTVTGTITGYATTSYVTTQISNLINGAPGLLDTLDELAAALGDDANFAATLTTSLSGKQGTITLTTTGTSGAATFVSNTLNIPNYGSALSGYLPLTGGTLTGSLAGTSATFSSSVSATTGTFSGKISANTSNGIFSNFGGTSIGTTNGNYTGISLGYSENTTYTKTAIVQEQINDGAARGHLHFLVDTANDGNNAVLGDSKMMINGTSGNVLIGTTTDAGYKLDVNGTGRFTSTLRVTNSGTNTLIWAQGGADGSGQGKGNIRSSDQSGANYWDFGRDNLTTGDFVITEYGGSPILRLRSSTGAATFSSTVTLVNDLTINASLTPLIFLNTTSTGKASGIITQESGTSRWAFGSSFGSGDGTFNIYNYGAAARYLTIATTGAATFSSSVTATSATITGSTDGFVNTNRSAVDYANGIRLQTAGSNNWLLGTAGNNNLIFYNYSLASSAIYINSSTNNVGIGTITPSSRLGVQTTGADGLVMEPDLGSVNNSVRLFFKSSVQTYGLFNNSGDLRFTYDAVPGNTSGTSLARFTNTGKYFRMEAGTGGIQFNGNTGAANALNAYEEGTWTPVVGGTTGNPTVSYFTQLGKYVKIGRVVHIFCQLRLSSSSGGSGNLIITGLPFTISGDSDETGGSIGLALGFATLPTVIQPEASTSYVFVMVNESNTPITDLDFTYFNFTVTYLVNT